MALTKAAQWIVWDARKNGKSFQTVLDAAAKNSQVTDTVEELEKAYIGSRPYAPQPQRTAHAQVLKANPYEQARRQVNALNLPKSEADGLLAAIDAKEKAAKAKAQEKVLDQLAQVIADLP